MTKQRLLAVFAASFLILAGCASLPGWLSLGQGTTDAVLSQSDSQTLLTLARQVVNDEQAQLADPIQATTVGAARRQYHIVSFDYEEQEPAYVLTVTPSNQGFTTIDRSTTFSSDGKPVGYTSVTLIYGKRNWTKLAWLATDPDLQSRNDASMYVRTTAGVPGSQNDPGISTSKSGMTTAIVMESNMLSVGGRYRAMGWTHGPATVEMKLLSRGESPSTGPSDSLAASASLIATASSDGMFMMTGTLAADYPGPGQLRHLNTTDFCNIPFVVNGKVAMTYDVNIVPLGQTQLPTPEPQASTTPSSPGQTNFKTQNNR